MYDPLSVHVARAEVAETGAIGPSTTLKHGAIERNKRCMLAYLGHRAELLTAMRWQFGAVLPPEVKLNMCEPETEFFSKLDCSIDKFHFKNHVDAYCHEHFDPNKKKDLDNVNTEICKGGE